MFYYCENRLLNVQIVILYVQIDVFGLTILNFKQSIVWTAILNDHIRKARSAMSFDLVGEKIVWDQITRKYPSDPNRYAP